MKKTTLKHAFIVAVNQLESVFSCVHCKKNIAVSDETIVTCDTCGTDQRLPASSKVTARLYIQDPSGETCSLRAYNDVLASITEGAAVSPKSLISAAPFNLTYNSYHVITSVYHV